MNRNERGLAERMIDAAAALMAASLLLAAPTVLLPLILIMLLTIWAGLLGLSGVAYSAGSLQRAGDFLVDLTIFFGIVEGGTFAAALVVGAASAALQDAGRWLRRQREKERV